MSPTMTTVGVEVAPNVGMCSAGMTPERGRTQRGAGFISDGAGG